MDQAAGLREWASRREADIGSCPQHVVEALVALAREGAGAPRRPPPAPSAPAPPPSPALASATQGRSGGEPVLMVLGLPGCQLDRVRELLDHWHDGGRRWVGRPERWRLVPVSVTDAHLPLLVEQQSHWALWVESDAEAFRRAWRLLLTLAEGPCPRRLLVVHPPGITRHGLLDNLRQAAAHYFGIELVVLA